MSDVPLCSIAVIEQLAAADLEDLEIALQFLMGSPEGEGSENENQ